MKRRAMETVKSAMLFASPRCGGRGLRCAELLKRHMDEHTPGDWRIRRTGSCIRGENQIDPDYPCTVTVSIVDSVLMGDHQFDITTSPPAAELIDCAFEYPGGREIFSQLNWRVSQGSFAVITGPTGSGKTTILRLLLRLVRPTAGAIHVLGESLAILPARHRPRLRRRIGVVAQELALLNDRTVEQNLILALAVAGKRGKPARRRVAQLLQDGHLMHRRHDYPVQLSGGERQRLAVARAASGFPELILADEPTAHLDAENSTNIVNWLNRLQIAGSTVIVVTHSPSEFRNVPGVAAFGLGTNGLRKLW